MPTTRVALPAVLLWLAAHAPAQVQERLHTDRLSPIQLPLPKETDAFAFAVFGDRTGGPAEGIKILAQAVKDVNLLDPDLVMTVGDLIQGYNTTEPWLEQMREFKATMSELRMPWFPVAGNHDVYWRGPDKPEWEHERNYETHFGPLWYAFEHKKCWFVVLYSDEGDPKTGERAIDKPACQKISEAQLTWLEQTLSKAKAASAVFVFLHHPRWLKRGYGDDWERVHRALAAAGNVKAVFGGHIHRMRYDGVRDGIEYFTLAAVGAELTAELPGAGYLHHFHVVMVRQGQISVAALPVGTVIDPRSITGQISEDCLALEQRLTVEQDAPLVVAADGSIDQTVVVRVANPSRRPIALTLELDSHDRRLHCDPDHTHPTLEPGKSTSQRFVVRRAASPLDANFGIPRWVLACDYLGEGLRVTLPERSFPADLTPPTLQAAPAPQANGVLRLDTPGSCLRLPDRLLAIPDGAFTVEGWLCATDLTGRRAFLNKTEGSEWGLFVSDGKPAFVVHVGGKYVSAGVDEQRLHPGQWHHLAGVFDGNEARLYLDGTVVARTPAQGSRLSNKLPLLIGADPNAKGAPTTTLIGQIDEVRISSGARYREERSTPLRRSEPDATTLLLLHLDADLGPWTQDASGQQRHPERLGDARCVLESEAKAR